MTDHVVSIVFSAVASIALAALLYTMLSKEVPVKAHAVSALAIQGQVVPVSSDDYPVTQIGGIVDGQPVALQLSGTSSELVFPAAVGASPVLMVPVDTGPVSGLCSGQFSSQPAGVWTVNTLSGVASTRVIVPHVGLGRRRRAGQWASPFLQTLAQHGYTGWTFSEHLKRVLILPGIAAAPCLVWSWTPLLVLPGYEDLYVIELDAYGLNPWKYAVLDVGFWLSNLPGSGPCTRAISLRAASGQNILLTPSTYVDYIDVTGPQVPLGPEVCVLGVSCLAWDSACAFDLANNRFGMSESLFFGNGP